jgi:hypothetical protein
MKAKIIAFLFIVFINFNTKAQDYTVKGQINTDIYSYYNVGAWFYTANMAYGITQQVDAGLYYSTLFLKNLNSNEFGLDVRYYLSPYIFKNTNKFDLYIKGSLGYLQQKSIDKTYETGIYSYSAFLGLRYYPFKRIGIMAEIGYGKLYDFNANFGLTFKLKK